MTSQISKEERVVYMSDFLNKLISTREGRLTKGSPDDLFVQIVKKILKDGENLSPDFLSDFLKNDKNIRCQDIKLENINLLHAACMVANNLAMKVLLKEGMN